MQSISCLFFTRDVLRCRLTFRRSCRHTQRRAQRCSQDVFHRETTAYLARGKGRARRNRARGPDRSDRSGRLGRGAPPRPPPAHGRRRGESLWHAKTKASQRPAAATERGGRNRTGRGSGATRTKFNSSSSLKFSSSAGSGSGGGGGSIALPFIGGQHKKTHRIPLTLARKAQVIGQISPCQILRRTDVPAFIRTRRPSPPTTFTAGYSLATTTRGGHMTD